MKYATFRYVRAELKCPHCGHIAYWNETIGVHQYDQDGEIMHREDEEWFTCFACGEDVMIPKALRS